MLKVEDRRSSGDTPPRLPESGEIPRSPPSPSQPQPFSVSNGVTVAAAVKKPIIHEGHQLVKGDKASPPGCVGVDDGNSIDNHRGGMPQDESTSSGEEGEEGGDDETSTASGTITEGGEWESRHAFDVEYAVEELERGEEEDDGGGEKRNGGKDVGGDESGGSPETGRKRNSLRWVFDNARWVLG